MSHPVPIVGATSGVVGTRDRRRSGSGELGNGERPATATTTTGGTDDTSLLEDILLSSSVPAETNPYLPPPVVSGRLPSSDAGVVLQGEDAIRTRPRGAANPAAAAAGGITRRMSEQHMHTTHGFSPIQRRDGAHPKVMPSHPPPPPPTDPTSPPPPTPTAAAPPAPPAPAAPAGRTNRSVSVSLPTTSTTAPLSPKTSKLLRRIRKREDELEALTHENSLLKEANRRANAERAVREHEKRIEAKRQAELDAARQQEISSLKSRLLSVHGEGFDPAEVHDPVECARTVDELTELLQLREEQLELINLDRAKLYEEVQTWKIGMEKLASLQSYGSLEAAAAAHLAQPSDEQEQSTASTRSDTKEESNTRTSFSSFGASPSSSSSSSLPLSSPSGPIDLSPVVESVYENQHRHPFFGFQPTTYPFMRHPFSDESGAVQKRFDEMPLPPGWVWDSQWHLDMEAPAERGEHTHARNDSGDQRREVTAEEETPSPPSSLDAKLSHLRSRIGLGSRTASRDQIDTSVGTDDAGWRYALQYKLFAWHPTPGRLDTVRRRRWIRRRCWVGEAATEAMMANAVEAIRAIGGARASHSKDRDGITIDDGTASDGKPSLSELAAAYSSGAPHEAFSMFVSVAPPGVGGQSREAANAKAIAAMMQIARARGQKGVSEFDMDAAAAELDRHAESTNTEEEGSDSSRSVTPAADINTSNAATSTTTTIATTTASTTSPANTSVIANLSSFLVNSRVGSWVTRRTNASEAESNSAASSIDPTVAAATAVAAPSAVCSYCSAVSRTAMQYDHPTTHLITPLASFCLLHYHACQAHIADGFHRANPNPLTSAQQEQHTRTSNLQPTLCGYCSRTDTSRVQVLHLAAATSADTTDALPSDNPSVLDVHDAYRFCSRHMRPFLDLVCQFQPQDAVEADRDEQLQQDAQHQEEASANESTTDDATETEDVTDEAVPSDAPATHEETPTNDEEAANDL